MTSVSIRTVMLSVTINAVVQNVSIKTIIQSHYAECINYTVMLSVSIKIVMLSISIKTDMPSVVAPNKLARLKHSNYSLKRQSPLQLTFAMPQTTR